MMQYILNTWIFVDRVLNGESQVAFLDDANELGADGVEVRYEYFTDRATEATAIRVKAANLGLTINLSVPDEVFVQGQVNQKLDEYFNFAKQLGVTKIKFNLGDFTQYTGDLAHDLLIPAGLTVNIENDQTVISGHSAPILEFLAAAQGAQVPVGYVYDLGNWAVMGEDATETARLLAPYVDYIHLKNMQGAENAVTTDLNVGKLDWHQVLDILSRDIDIAIEFPITETQHIAQQLALVKAYKGDF
ncbi:sugar phosphate isomerase/epimerase family protein [Weissella soli]|uniref:sugar phosphate isomerase/epimerase family protein n=1 Tax=Weissella soli TaxID=155866 RepID=UPI001F22B805|nr:TIM barrel protein [Weissella soli]